MKSQRPNNAASVWRTCWRSFTLTALLLWPVAYFGHPAYFPDTAAYYSNGEIAARTVAARIVKRFETRPSAAVTGRRVAALTARRGAAPLETRGQRSLPFSLLTYLLSGPRVTFLALVVAQTAATAWLIVLFLDVMVPEMPVGTFAGVSLALATLTTLPWFACFTEPDILAGAMVLATLLLAQGNDRLGAWSRLGTLALYAVAVSAHASHLPLAAAMFGVIFLREIREVLSRQGTGHLRTLALSAAPILLGVTAVVVTLYAGFGKVSPIAERYPIALARSIEDGPARWYLDKHCASEHYAVCELATRMPPTAGEFLWGEGGVVHNATAEQMNRIRAEEGTILERAAMAYPYAQARAALRNFAIQFVSFRAPEQYGVRFDRRWLTAPDGSLRLIPGPQRLRNATIFHVAQYAGVIVGAALLGAWWRKMDRDERWLVWLLGVALIVNAAICGVISAPVDRYQGRLIWLVPLLTMVVWLRRHRKIEITPPKSVDQLAGSP